MSRPPNVCPQCGAPPEAFPPEVTSITCHFCGATYGVQHPDARKRRREQEREEHRRQKEAQEEKKKREKSRESSAGCAAPILILALVGGIFGGTYWYEEVYKPRQWDGHHDWSCKSGDVTFTDLQATGDVDARGSCTLTLVRPQFESHIHVRDHAVLKITGGRIHDTNGTVIDAEGFGKVTLDGTNIDGVEAVRAKGSASIEFKNNPTVTGRVRVDNPSQLVGWTPPAASASSSGTSPATPATAVMPSAPKDLTRFPCQGVVECFQSWDGKFSGKVTFTLDKDGFVKRTNVSGTSNAAIKACLQGLSSKKELSIASGNKPPGAGDLVCSYSGTRSGFITQVSTSGSFNAAPQ